ncbi:putative reverse transcriptase domain-containing protein [Tanacetum coccineum]
MSPNLLSILTLSPAESSGEPMRKYLTVAHDLDYVPEPIYPEYIPLEEEHVFPVEEQPLPPIVSPTAESPGYVVELDPEEDPEEYEDDETEDGSVDYPMDGGDDGDDDDGDSFRDDADDEDEDEEEEHLASANSTVVVPTVELVSPPEGIKPVIPPPSTDISTTGARITVRLQAFISLPPEAEVEKLIAMTTPSPSPPISLSPPSAGERLARCTAPLALSSPPLVSLPLLPSSGCPTQIQTLRIASTQALVDAVTAALPPPPLPPSLYLPLPVDRRDDIPESEQPTRKRRSRVDYGFVSTVDAEARRQGISEVGYGIRDTWIDTGEAIPEIAPMTVREVNTKVTELAELHERDTQDLYALLEDALDGRTRISQLVAMDSQLVDLLMGDRMTLQETVWIVEGEAYASREAWAHSIGLSQATHQELQFHRDHHHGASDPTVIHEYGIRDPDQAYQNKTTAAGYSSFQTCTRPRLFTAKGALRGQQRRARQPGPEARIPDHQDASGDADSAALTWWNCQIRTLGPEAYAMTWEVLKKKMTDKYYLQGENKKLEIELWNLKVKGNDVPTYTERFQELTLICTKFVANETEKVDKYINGLPDNIYGNVKFARPKMLDETIELANDLMDQKLRTYAERQSNNKRKADDSSRNNYGHQQ